MGKHKYRASGPKRNVIRKVFKINDGILAVTSTTTLFTALVDCTLIRMIFDFVVKGDRLIAPGVDMNWASVISLAPAGVTVAPDPRIVEGDYGDLTDEFITCFSGGDGFRNGTTDVDIVLFKDTIFRDIRGMRKLKKSDKIIWVDIANIAPGYDVAGNIHMFFKET